VAFLAASEVGGDPLGYRLPGAHAMRDFKRHRLRGRAAPATVNLELAAIDAPQALGRREHIELSRGGAPRLGARHPLRSTSRMCR
jgi:hypothetical protein